MSGSAFILRDFRASDAAEVRRIIATVLGEYGLAPECGGVDADLEDIRGSYIARGGVFRIVEDGHGAIVGCGGLFPLDAEEAEIRKMYFLPTARGHGLGRQLLRELIEAARSGGYRRLVLETASVLKEAIALYRSFGFRPAMRRHLASRCDQAYALELGGAAMRSTGAPEDVRGH
ncbi:MAG: GNAT family N-acetyltransferase [Gammaproteobacteria bacterium]|nr:GNAT family N-acetyltransferase [Gammaproteobacteria bacterium]